MELLGKKASAEYWLGIPGIINQHWLKEFEGSHNQNKKIEINNLKQLTPFRQIPCITKKHDTHPNLQEIPSQLVEMLMKMWYYGRSVRPSKPGSNTSAGWEYGSMWYSLHMYSKFTTYFVVYTCLYIIYMIQRCNMYAEFLFDTLSGRLLGSPSKNAHSHITRCESLSGGQWYTLARAEGDV